MQVFVPDFSVTKYFAVWTAAACCSFRLDSLLWTIVLNSIELSAS
jgi:hypothetical protein